VGWYYSSIYDIYFLDNCVDSYIVYSDNNDNNDIINDILINNLNTKCKENMKDAQQKKIIWNMLIILIARLLSSKS